MKLMKTLLAATAIMALAAGAAQAKQLIYCSEASPKHFDPGHGHRRQRLRRLRAHHL